MIDRQSIAQRICAGELLFVHKQRVINATRWAKYHPGSELAILHFVGRDATDEVEAYHSTEALQKLERLVIDRIEGDWIPLLPPISLGLVRHPDGEKGHWTREGQVRLGKGLSGGVIELTPAELEPAKDIDLEREKVRSYAYRDLKAKIEAAGLFKRPGLLAGYGSDLLRYGFLATVAFGLFFRTTGWIGQMGSATFLGMLFHQLTFLAHDAGHAGVTTNHKLDRLLGIFVADWIGGLSIGWWCDNHNIHHLVTNHPEHDPDIQHIPFFAISKQFFGSLWSTYYKRVMAFDAFSRTMIALQHRLYFVVLSLARFNLYANSYSYLLGRKPKRNRFWYLEMAGIAFYWIYFGAMLRSLPTLGMRVAYLLVSHIVSSPVHVQITLSHFACSTEDLGPRESFASRQLRTTMDVICSPDIEFLHGGLHLQVTHHLFPRMPRHNLRKASLFVKEYCREQEIVYKEHGFVDGNRQVLGVLEEVAQQLQFLKTVAEADVQK